MRVRASLCFAGRMPKMMRFEVGTMLTTGGALTTRNLMDCLDVPCSNESMATYKLVAIETVAPTASSHFAVMWKHRKNWHAHDGMKNGGKPTKLCGDIDVEDVRFNDDHTVHALVYVLQKVAKLSQGKKKAGKKKAKGQAGAQLLD